MAGRHAWAAIWLCALLASPPAFSDTLDLRATRIALAPSEPETSTVGGLTFRGGLKLTASDGRFGGLSGLVISDDGARLTSITDTGLWFEGRLVYGADGALIGLTDAVMTPLRNASGQALSGKRASDSESLARAPDGSLLVSFERDHRVLRYAAPGETGQPVSLPIQNIGSIRNNGGMEAMEFLADGRLLILTEDYFVTDGRLAGWISDGAGVAALTYPGNGYFKPTGLTRLPDGRMLVLERGYTAIGGPKARLMVIDPPGGGAIDDLTELARLQPPIQVDNYEGVAARVTDSGETLLYIVSDDNFNALQRTLLLMFAISE